MGKIEDALRKLEIERRKPGSAALTRGPARVAAGPPSIDRFLLEDAENSLEVDKPALLRWGSVAMLESDEQAAKEYGQIKRPIIAQAMSKTLEESTEGANVVVITSAGPGEGKSVTALNLALSLAREKDLSVLLIDADVLNPNLSGALGLQRAPGLTNLIANDSMQVKDVTWKTSIPRLYFMSAGTERAGAAELLDSQRMHDIVEMLGRALPRTVTVIDSPPILLTNEARVLASLAGQVVLVVRADRTPRLLVTEAISYLDPAKPLGLVLNATRTSETSFYAGIYGEAEESDGELGQTASSERH